MGKDTEDLQRDLFRGQAIEAFVRENEDRFVEPAPGPMMERMYQARKERSVTKAELARRAGMSDVYLHQVFSGKRKPSRDRVLCFCVGLDATVEETQKLLEQASLAQLYPRNRRDAIVLHGLAHGTALDAINDALFAAGEETLC